MFSENFSPCRDGTKFYNSIFFSNLERHLKDTSLSQLIKLSQRVELHPGKVITGPLKETNSHAHTRSECGWLYSLVFPICLKSLCFIELRDSQSTWRDATQTQREHADSTQTESACVTNQINRPETHKRLNIDLASCESCHLMIFIYTSGSLSSNS